MAPTRIAPSHRAVAGARRHWAAVPGIVSRPPHRVVPAGSSAPDTRLLAGEPPAAAGALAREVTDGDLPYADAPASARPSRRRCPKPAPRLCCSHRPIAQPEEVGREAVNRGAEPTRGTGEPMAAPQPAAWRSARFAGPWTSDTAITHRGSRHSRAAQLALRRSRRRGPDARLGARAKVLLGLFPARMAADRGGADWMRLAATAVIGTAHRGVAPDRQSSPHGSSERRSTRGRIRRGPWRRSAASTDRSESRPRPPSTRSAAEAQDVDRADRASGITAPR